MDTNRHYIQFAFNVFQWLKSQPLLGNFPLARLKIVQTNTWDLFGLAGWYGIDLFIDNIIEKCLSFDVPEKYAYDPKKRLSFVDRMIKYTIIETLIHESYHLYCPTDYEKYEEDIEYHHIIEDTIDYNTHIFISNNYRTLEYVFGKLLLKSSYNYDGMNDILKRNKYVRIINPNDYALLFNMCGAFGCPGNMCMEAALYKNVTVVLDIDGDIKTHIIRKNYYVDYFWVGTLYNNLCGKSIYEIIGDYKDDNLTINMKGESELYKPYKFVPYRRNIQY